jgi:hypothetical protein
MQSRSRTSTFGRDAARVATLRSRTGRRDRGDSESLSAEATTRQLVVGNSESVLDRDDGPLPDTADVRLQRWREVLARKRRAHASRSDSVSGARAARSRSPDSQRRGPQTLLFRRRRRHLRPDDDGDECASDDRTAATERSGGDGADDPHRRFRFLQGNDDADLSRASFLRRGRRRRRRVSKCVAMDDASESARSPPHGGDVRVREEVVRRIHLQMRHCSNYALDVVCDIIGDYAATSVLSPVGSASSVSFLRCTSTCVEPSTL